MLSPNAAFGPPVTNVKASMAKGRYSTGIWMTKKVALRPRLSCANVYTSARISAVVVSILDAQVELRVSSPYLR